MILTLLRTFISRFLLLCIMLVGFVPMLIFFMLPESWRFNSRFFYWFVDLFYWLVLKFSFVPISIKGKENIPEDPAIIAANHQSSLDIPLVGSLLGGHPQIWLATHELMQSPILRFVIPKMAILVDMRSPMKGMRSLIQAIRITEKYKMHVMIFPEGQRYPDDKVHEFFGGFVILAKKTGRPVVPVRIFHANKVYPKDSFLVKWHPITVVVGKPMHYQENETDETFKKRVHDWFVAQKE